MLARGGPQAHPEVAAVLPNGRPYDRPPLKRPAGRRPAVLAPLVALVSRDAAAEASGLAVGKVMAVVVVIPEGVS